MRKQLQALQVDTMENKQNFRIKRGWMNLQIVKISTETHDTKTLYLVDQEMGGRAFDYRAGQYLTFRFDALAAKPLVRSYTIASSPCEADYITITVKVLDKGIVSNFLCHGLKAGDILRARGPIGRFCYFPEKDQKHLAMVAAGSGVTPFVSIMREYYQRLGASDAPQKMTLLVSYRSTEDLISWPELTTMQKHPGIRIITTLSREKSEDKGFLFGRINNQMLTEVFNKDDLAHTTFMTCGPQEMMDSTCQFLNDHKVPSDQIKVESYETT